MRLFWCFWPIDYNFLSLEDHLENCARDTKFNFLQDCIKLMKGKFDEYWPYIKDDALICQLLDPRFKHASIVGTNKKNVITLFSF